MRTIQLKHLSQSELARKISIWAISIGLLFFGFFSNLWHVADISVALDLAYAAYSLGYQKQEEAPRIWAERLLNLIIKQRDPETGIWSNLVHPQISKRGLNVFGRQYPQATEPRVYVGNQLNHTVTQMMGMNRRKCRKVRAYRRNGAHQRGS